VANSLSFSAALLVYRSNVEFVMTVFVAQGRSTAICSNTQVIEGRTKMGGDRLSGGVMVDFGWALALRAGLGLRLYYAATILSTATRFRLDGAEQYTAGEDSGLRGAPTASSVHLLSGVLAAPHVGGGAAVFVFADLVAQAQSVRETVGGRAVGDGDVHGCAAVYRRSNHVLSPYYVVHDTCRKKPECTC